MIRSRLFIVCVSGEYKVNDLVFDESRNSWQFRVGLEAHLPLTRR